MTRANLERTIDTFVGAQEYFLTPQFTLIYKILSKNYCVMALANLILGVVSGQIRLFKGEIVDKNPVYTLDPPSIEERKQMVERVFVVFRDP